MVSSRTTGLLTYSHETVGYKHEIEVKTKQINIKSQADPVDERRRSTIRLTVGVDHFVETCSNRLIIKIQ